MFSKLFGSKSAAHASPEVGEIAQQTTRTQRDWKRVLVPAVDAAYSMRSLEVAFRLAQGTGATVQLAFLVVVPRSLPLEAAMPDTEFVAAAALRDAQEAAQGYKLPVEAFVHRARSAPDGILKLITQEDIDLLVLGGRPDGLRGLPGDMIRDLFERAPCEVVVDYIAGEK